MNAITRSTFSLLLLAAGAPPALANGDQQPPPVCDEKRVSITQAECDAVPQKYQPLMALSSPDVGIKASCPKILGLPPSIDKRCVDPNRAPSPSLLNCESNGNGFMCEAWPQGDGITYGWSVSGSVRLPTPGTPDNPFRTAACWKGGAGSITVTVTSPYALTSSHTRSVYCSP